MSTVVVENWADTFDQLRTGTSNTATLTLLATLHSLDKPRSITSMLHQPHNPTADTSMDFSKPGCAARTPGCGRTAEPRVDSAEAALKRACAHRGISHFQARAFNGPTRRRTALEWLGLVLLFGFTVGATAQSQPPSKPLATVAALQQSISNHLAQARFSRAAWGLKVISLDTGKTLFEHNAEKLMKPASNAKLFTGALALDRLGPDYRIKTSLHATARPNSSGTLKGDLIVYGRGDPSFAARFNHGDYSKSLEPLVAALAATGVKRIRGDLIGDESFFRGPPLGSGWNWDDLQYYYGAEVSALTVDDNVLDLLFMPAARIGEPCRLAASPDTTFLTFINRTLTAATGAKRDINLYRPIGENIVYASGQLPRDDPGYTDAVAVHEPARFFLVLFQEALARRGLSVSGRLRTIHWLSRETAVSQITNLVELCFVESRPLSEILGQMLKPSQNLYAHLLLLQVAARKQEAEAGDQRDARRNLAPPENNLALYRTTEAAGIKELNAFLEEVGVKKGEVLLEEGSGLSRGGLLAPNATVTLLKFMSRHRYAEIFRESLPIGGIDGTLKSRLRGTAAAGNARAKTGSLRYVNTLSGYITSAAGERLAFSIMLNNYFSPDATGPGRADIDTLAVMLANFTGHSEMPVRFQAN